MGVIDKTPGKTPQRDEEGNFIFSSKPGAPGDRGGDLLVKFQAVTQTQNCIAQQCLTVNARTKLSHVRRAINKYFRNHYERGFIFLSKSKEIMKSREKQVTLFDILPKLPRVGGSQQLPTAHFQFPDVQYKKVFHDYDGRRYSVTCACVVFLYERSSVSHWPAAALRHELSADILEGFSFIPTDIMSWPQRLIDSRATSVHIQASQICKPCLKEKQREEYNLAIKDALERAIQQVPPRTRLHDLCDCRLATPLHYAASSGNLDHCELLVAGMGKDQLYAVDINGKTPLHCAIYDGSRRNMDTVVYLLQQNSDIFQCDLLGLSPFDLLMSMRDDKLENISQKLEFDCASTDLCIFFLDIALKKKNEKHALMISKQLCISGPKEYNRDSNQYERTLDARFDFIEFIEMTLLHHSAFMNVEITKNILAGCEVDILTRDVTGRLPFHVACRSGNIEQLELLYCDDITDSDFRLAIKIALRSKEYAACRYITNLRPDLPLDEETVCTIRDILNTMLNKCRSQNSDILFRKWENVAKELFPVICRENDAISVYVFDAAYHNLHSSLECMKDLGVDFNIHDAMGRTPLHEAAQQNSIKCFNILLDSTVYLNCTDQRGSTALHYACEMGCLGIVKTLMEREARADIQDNCGRTPLMVCIYHKRFEVAAYLIRRCPNRIGLHLKDKFEQSILHYSVSLPEEMLDDLLREMSVPTNFTNSELAFQKEESRALSDTVWLWSMQASSFKASFSEQTWSEHPKAFHGKISCSLWRDTEWLPKERSIADSPKRKFKVCNACNRARLLDKHKCPARSSNDADNPTSVDMIYKPFQFHELKQTFVLSPAHSALRARKYGHFRKLVRFDPKHLSSKDNLGRSLIQFALEQNSLKMMKAVLEMDRKAVKNCSLIPDFLIRSKLFPEKEDTKILIYLLNQEWVVENISQSVDFNHRRCGLHLDQNESCRLLCHLRSYHPLEASIRNGNEAQFKLILEKSKLSNLGLGLHFVSYFGNGLFIELFHRKRQKLLTELRENNDIKDMLKLDSLYALNLACSSPHIDPDSLKVLLKYHSEALKSENCISIDDLHEIRQHIKKDIDPTCIREMTPLARMLSKRHPRNNSRQKKSVDDMGCILIDSGLNLGRYKYDDGESQRKIHGACEAIHAAIKSKHFKSAFRIIENAGDVVWQCALTKQRCDVQSEFIKTLHTRDREESFSISFIKYLLFLLTKLQTPETLLQSFLRQGESYVKDCEEIQTMSVEEVRLEKRSEVENIPDPIIKLLLSVCELIAVDKLQSGDILRILRYAPTIYPYIGGLDTKLLMKTSLDQEEAWFYRTMARVMAQSEILDHIQPPAGFSILHAACCTDKADFIRMILESPIPPRVGRKINEHLRPVDVASSFGYWQIVLLLIEKGAHFTPRTLLACCAQESYSGLSSWAIRLNRMTGSGTASVKSRTKIFKELIKCKDLDLRFETEEDGSILFNAMKNKLCDIVDIIIEKSPLLLVKALNEEANICRYFVNCKKTTMENMLVVFERNITNISTSSLGTLLITLIREYAISVVERLSSAMQRSLTFDTWCEILKEKDHHGKTALHHVAIQGFSSACKIFVRSLSKSNKEQDSVLNLLDCSKTPALWYALAYGHWNLANTLILGGSSPNFLRAVPDFRPRRYLQFEKPNTVLSVFECTSSTKFVLDGNLVKQKRAFPLIVNTSSRVAECINPGRRIFGKRKLEQIIKSAEPATHDKSDMQATKNVVKRSRDKQDTKRLFDSAVIATNCRTSLLHLACNTGNEKLAQRIVELRTLEASGEDIFHFTPFVHSLLSGRNNGLENVWENHGLQNFPTFLFDVLLWKGMGRKQQNLKRLELSLLHLIEVILLEAHPKETVQAFSKKISKLQHRSSERISLEFVSIIDKSVEILREDPSYSLDEEQVKSMINIHKYARSVGEKERVASLVLSDQEFPSTLDGEYLKKVFLRLLENKSKTYKNFILLMILSGSQWCSESLMETAMHDKNLRDMLSSKVFGPFSFPDLFILSASNWDNKESSVTRGSVLKDILSTFCGTVDDSVVLFATEHRMWDILRPVAVMINPKAKGEFTLSWHRALAVASMTGELDFIKASLEGISISKLSEKAKICLKAHLCLACLSGNPLVTRYFLRIGVPLLEDTTSPIIRDVMGRNYHHSWSTLHYCIKGNNKESIESVLKNCKHDKNFMQAMNYESIFKLACKVGNCTTVTSITRLFKESRTSPSAADWESYLLEAAKWGHEEICANLIDSEYIDVRCVDKRNRNLLHYCALRNMKKLLSKLLKTLTSTTEKDLDGYLPHDYAFYLGHQDIVGLLETKRTESFGFKIPTSHFAFGWFRRLIEKNADEYPLSHGENTDPHGYERRLSPSVWHFTRADRSFSLENVIQSYDDRTVQVMFKLSSYGLQQTMIERPKEYGNLFHLLARYGHAGSMHTLCSFFRDTPFVLEKFLLMEWKGLIPLAVAIQNSHKECAEILMQIKTCEDWKSSRTGETVCHYAVKTGNKEIVLLVLSYVSQQPLDIKDKNNCSLPLVSLALSHHHLLPVLDADKRIVQHCTHTPENIEYDCEACLLDEALGWSKVFQSKLDVSVSYMRSLSSMGLKHLKHCRKLQKSFLQTGLRSSVVKAVSYTMGYEPTINNILTRLAMQPFNAIEANILMSQPEFSSIALQLPRALFDPVQIFARSIQFDREDIFHLFQSELFDIIRQFQNRYGVSCFEAIIGFGSYKCLDTVQKSLDIDQEDFEIFTDIKDTLPVAIKLIARLEIPGDEDWLKRYDNHDDLDTSQRLSSADIWLVSTIPEKFKLSIEQTHADANWIPQEINGKTFTPDLESFKKNKILTGRTPQWIKCLVGSGAIAGSLRSISQMKNPKMKRVQTIKVSCVQSGSNEHARVAIDGSGVLQGAVELLNDANKVYVVEDRSLYQRSVEVSLREELQSQVLPHFTEYLMENFNLDVTMKVDWNSIEIRKRNWNIETILNALTGQIFSNKLGGLEDVLKECFEMKTDIESMFNKETAIIAMGSAVDLKEITVTFEDKRPTFNEFLAQKSQILKEKCTWCFALEKGCLSYNRESFPLWRNLFFYRGICASLCSAVHSLSIIDPERSISSPLSDKSKNLTLDIEWKSFGVKELSSVRSLIAGPIAREVQGIAYDCLGMLRLSHTCDHVVVKYSPSQQHSGINFHGNSAVISVHPSMNSKREWEVERSNADIKLAEVEDRQLTNEWDANSLEKARENIHKVEKEVEKITGLSIRISIDEKRILLSEFPKLRRELTHPSALIIKATEKGIFCIKDIFVEFMTSLLQSPQFSPCRNVQVFKHDSGAWVKVKPSRERQDRLGENVQYNLVPTVLTSNCAQCYFRPWSLNYKSYDLRSDTQIQESHSPSFSKTIGSWEFQKTSDVVSKPNFLSFENVLYAVGDVQELTSHLEKLPKKVTVAHDVTEVIELNGRSFLKDRFLPPLLPRTSFSLNVLNIAHMCQHVKERLLKLLPIGGIEFDEESFLRDTVNLMDISQCVECILDTAHGLVIPEKTCFTKHHRHQTLFRILSKIKTIKVSLEKEQRSNTTSTERILVFDKQSSLSRITVSSNKTMTIIFSNKSYTKAFLDEFKLALVHFAELLLQELFQIKHTRRASSATTSSLWKHTVDINRVLRPTFESTLDVFPEICEVYQKLAQLIPPIRTLPSTKATNVCLSNTDGDMLRAHLNGETLLIYIPSIVRSTKEFPPMLLSTLGVSDNQIQDILPVFQVRTSHIFYPERDHGTVVLGFYNLVKGSGHRMSFDHHKLQEEFRIRLKGKTDIRSEDVTIENIELGSNQEIAIKWKLNEIHLSTISLIHILFRGQELETACAPLLPKHLYKTDSVTRGNKEGLLNVSKNGYFPLLLMHQKFSSFETDRDDKGSAGSQTLIMRKKIQDVDFIIRAERKPFPSSIPNNPIKITKHPGSKSHMIYRVEVLDSKRSAAITAVCKCCGQFLSLATPEWLMQPGEALFVNCKEEV